MTEHAKPGEGVLSLEDHRKLEDLLFGRHTTLSVYIATVVFLIAIFSDRGLNSFALAPFLNSESIGEVELVAWVLLAVGVVVSVYYVVVILFRSYDVILTPKAAYVLVTLISFFMAIDYFFQGLSLEMGLGYVLGFYYLVCGCIAFRVSLHDSSYLSDRIKLSNDYASREVIIATSIAVIAGIFFLIVLDDVVFSWAYVVTFCGIFWASVNRVFVLKD